MYSPVLIGPAGVGKTAAGHELSRLLEIPFVDCDEEFVEAHGSIDDFINERGWKAFRETESDLLTRLCEYHSASWAVLMPGAGAVANARNEDTVNRNVKLLLGFGVVFYLIPSDDLRLSATHIVSSLGRKKHFLTGSTASLPGPGQTPEFSRVYSLLNFRHPLYMRVADHVVHTANKPPLQVAAEIRLILLDGYQNHGPVIASQKSQW